MPLLVKFTMAVAGGVSAWHIPHDDVHDVACAYVPGGGTEWVIVAGVTDDNKLKALSSRDDGLTWLPVAGEGLERAQALRVETWHGMGRPLFVIGTTAGPWIYDPERGTATVATAGLGTQDLRVAELSAPLGGPGPVILATAAGNVYLLSPGASAWQPSLTTGTADRRAQVAIAPHYAPGGASPRDRQMLAGVAGVLYVSVDGGASWSVHPQFSTPAVSEDDWHLTALAFTEDFAVGGGIVLGRGRRDLAAPTGTAGQIWVSAPGARTFTLRHVAESSVRALLATSPGPQGARHVFAAMQHYPDPAGPATGEGVLRSDDGGFTWDDRGNQQDFLVDELDTSVGPDLMELLGLAAAPDFAVSGVLMFGRTEGGFCSRDAGVSWRPLRTRSELHVTDLDAGRDASGATAIFATTYGSALLRHDAATGAGELLNGAAMQVLRPLALSPNFAADGMLAVGGHLGLEFWFDPAQPAANPFGALGWLFDPAQNFGYVRTIAASPRFDASGATPGSDAAIFWSNGGRAAPERTYVSYDGGMTATLVDQDATGRDLPWLQKIVVAPTFDAATAQGRTDVYACAGSILLRLEDQVWRPISAFASGINAIALHPDFSRPLQPRLLVALDAEPFLVAVDDGPSGAVVTPLAAPGLQGEIRSLKLGADFALRPIVYASTWGGGVLRLDLGAMASGWQPVNGPYPRLYSNPMALSPDFASDRRIFVGTQAGVLAGADLPGAPWILLPIESSLDNRDPGFSTFSPSDPANPQPDRPWRWSTVDTLPYRASSPDLELVGSTALVATHDGARVECEVLARSVTIRTLRGPTMGAVRCELVDLASGAILAAATADLHAGGAVRSQPLTLTLAQPTAVLVRVETALDPGEFFVLDAVTVTR